jgi:mono/diheme cytochrome c family protein
VIWDVQTTDRDKSYAISGPPRVAKGKVVIGNGGAELGVRGYVPGNPADGFENALMEKIAKTWTGEWWKWGGGGALTNGWKMQNKSRVLVYKIDGAVKLPPLPADNRTMPKPAPATGDQHVIAQGKQYYQRHCRYCHGDGLRTGNLNPDLRWSSAGIHKQWQDIVIGGSLKQLGMVSFKDDLTPDNAEAIRQYVLAEATNVYAELYGDGENMTSGVDDK